MADGTGLDLQRARPEVLGPGEGMVRLLIADTPMSPTVRDLALPAGLSILEMLEQAGVKPRLARLGVVRIDGAEIPRALWERVRPRPGVTVVFGVRPTGRGSLRIFLQILIAVAVVVLVLVGQPLAAAVVAVVGQIALSFVPPPRPRIDPESAPTYAIEGSRNDARLYQPTSVVLGRRRQVLEFAARPYTEVVGDDLHLRLLLTPGVGPAQIEDIRIGSTSISEFDQVEIEVRFGLPDDAPISLITSTPVEEAPQTTLSIEAGDVVRDVPGGEIDEISIDITFARGLVEFSGRERRERTVAFNLHYRRIGETEWRNVFPPPADLGIAAEQIDFPRFSSLPIPSTDYANLDALLGQYYATDWQLTARETSPVRRSRRWGVPRGRYQVRIRRTTPEPTGEDIVDQATWTALRGVRLEAPRVPPNTPLVAIRLRASEQLQGQLDPISAIVTSIRPRHDPSTGVLGQAAPTRNPADLFLAIARGPGNSRPLGPNRIDFEGLADWAQLCAARGWTADLVIDDGRSVADALASVAAAGRARPAFNRGRLSVVVDVPRDPSGQVFTPYNTRNFSFRKVFARRPHAYRVSFANEDKDYRPDERIVYAPGYSIENATDFEQIAFEPIVNADRAAEMAAYYIAVTEHRAEEFTFEMDAEAAVTEVGSRSWLSHDAILEGLAWGRAQSWLDQSGAALPLDAEGQPPAGAQVWGVVLDQPIERAAGVNYGAVIRSVDAARFVAVAGGAAVSTELRFSAPLPGAPLRAGDLVSFGLAGQETIEVQVRAKSRPDSQGVVTITCEPYGHPAIDQAASADQGPWTSTVRRPWAQLPPRPILNSAVWQDTGVVVDFSLPTGPEQVVAGIEARWREASDAANPSGWLRLPDLAPADRRAVTPPPPLNAAVDIELQAYDAFGRRGPALLVAGIAAAEPTPAPVVLSVLPASLNGPQGSQPAIEIRTDPPTDGRALSLLAQVRLAGSGEGGWSGLATFDPSQAVHTAPAAGAPGATMEVRLRHETRRGAISAWVGPFALTLPGQVASNTLMVGARTATQISADVANAVAAANAAFAEAASKASATSVATLTSDFNAVRDQVNSPSTGNAALSTAIANEVAQRTSGDSAIAASLNTLSAEVVGARGGAASLSARQAQLDQARIDGDTALASRATALEAQARSNANLFPNPSGVTDAAGSTSLRGFQNNTLGLRKGSYSPIAPSYFYFRFDNQTFNGYAEARADVAADPGTYTFSWTAALYGSTGEFQVVILSGTAGGVFTAIGYSGIAGNRRTITVVQPSGGATLRFVIYRNGTVVGSSYAELQIWDIKCEVGPVATLFRADAQEITQSARSAAVETATTDGRFAQASSVTLLEARAGSALGALNDNPIFSQSWSSGSIPTGWQEWQFGWDSTIQPGRVGAYALQFVSPATRPAGLTLEHGVLAYLTASPGWYVIEADVELLAGPLTGAGLLAASFNAADSYIGDGRISFGTDPDFTGVAPGVGVTGRVYRFRKLVQAPVNTVAIRLYVIANYGPFGGPVAKTIRFHRASIRPADPAEALITTVQSVSADAQGRARAVTGTQTEVNGRRGGMVLANDGSIAGFLFDADYFYLGRPGVGGGYPFRFQNNVLELDDATIRNLLVSPSPGATAKHRVALRPNRFSGADGAVIAYGGVYEGLPLIQPLPHSLAAPPTGAAYDIRAVNVTATSFQVRAKQLTPGAVVAQTATGGVNVGGTPQWRMHKPTVADANDGNYVFQFDVRLPFQYYDGPTGTPVFSQDPQSGGQSVYGGAVELWARINSVWTKIRTEYLEQYGGSDVYDWQTSANISANIGQTTDYEFAIHPVGSVIILAFDAVRYNTQTASNETALAGNFSFDVYAPT